MNFLESRHVSIRITRLLLYSLLFFFSWTSEGFSYTDELYQAVYAVANPGITPTTRQQALVFKHNKTINMMRLNGDIPNGVFIKNQEFFDSLNSKFSLDSANENGLNLAVQQKDPNAIPKAGTDTDNLLSRGGSGEYITPEQAQNVKKTYNQKVKKWLDKMEEGDTGYHDWSHETDTDFMVNRSDVASENDFRKISETINAEGGTAYVRGDAANAEAAIRAGDDISFKQANSYIDEMMDLSDQKFHKADYWDQKYFELKKTTPKLGTQAYIDMKMARGEAHLARAQGGKYIDRINKVNAKLGKQFNIAPTLLDSPGFKALKEAIDRGPKTGTQAGQIAALKKQLSQHVAEAYAETLAKVAKKYPYLTKKCQQSMAKVLGSLPDSAVCNIIDRLRSEFGDKFAKGLNEELKAVNAIKQSGLKYNPKGSKKPGINTKGNQLLDEVKEAGNDLAGKNAGKKYKNISFDDFELLPNANDVSKEVEKGIKKKVSKSKSYKKLNKQYKNMLDQQMEAYHQRAMARRQEYLKKMSKQQIDDLANLRAIWNKSLTSPFKEAMDGFMLMDAANILVDSLRAWQKDDLSAAIYVAGTQTTMLVGMIYLFNTGIKAGQSAGILGPLAWEAIKKEAARRGLHTGAGKLIIHGLEKLGSGTVKAGSAIGSAGAKLLPVLNYYFMAKTIETLAQGSVDLATEHVYGPYRYKKLIALYGDKDEDRSEIKGIRDFEIDDMYSFWEWMKIRGYVTRPSRESLFFVFPSPNALKVALEMYHDWFKEQYVFAGASKWTTDEELWSSLREMAMQDYFTTAAKQYQEQQKELGELQQAQITEASLEKIRLEQEKKKKLDLSTPPFQLGIGDIISKDETFYTGLKGRFAVNYVVMGNPGSQVKLEVTATIRSGEKIITEFRLINPGKTDVDFDEDIGEEISFLPVLDMPEEPGSYRLTVEVVGSGLPDKAAEDQKPFSLKATKSIAITVKDIKEKDKPILEDKGGKPEKEIPPEEAKKEETAEEEATGVEVSSRGVESGQWVDKSPDTDLRVEDSVSQAILRVYPDEPELTDNKLHLSFDYILTLPDLDLSTYRSAARLDCQGVFIKDLDYFDRVDKSLAQKIQDEKKRINNKNKERNDAEKATAERIKSIQRETELTIKAIEESGHLTGEVKGFEGELARKGAEVSIANAQDLLQISLIGLDNNIARLKNEIVMHTRRRDRNRIEKQEAMQLKREFDGYHKKNVEPEESGQFNKCPGARHLDTLISGISKSLPFSVSYTLPDRQEQIIDEDLVLGWGSLEYRTFTNDDIQRGLESKKGKLKEALVRIAEMHAAWQNRWDIKTRIMERNHNSSIESIEMHKSLAVVQAEREIDGQRKKISDLKTALKVAKSEDEARPLRARLAVEEPHLKAMAEALPHIPTKYEKQIKETEDTYKKRSEERDEKRRKFEKGHAEQMAGIGKAIIEKKSEISKQRSNLSQRYREYLEQRNFSDLTGSEHFGVLDIAEPGYYTGQLRGFAGRHQGQSPGITLMFYKGIPVGVLKKPVLFLTGEPPVRIIEDDTYTVSLYRGNDLVNFLELGLYDREKVLVYGDKQNQEWYGLLDAFKRRYAELTSFPPETDELKTIAGRVREILDDFGWLTGEEFYRRVGLSGLYSVAVSFTKSEIDRPSEASVEKVAKKWAELFKRAIEVMDELRARAEAAWDRFSKGYRVKQDETEENKPDLNKILAALNTVTAKQDSFKGSSSSRPYQDGIDNSRNTGPFKKSTKEFLYGNRGTLDEWSKDRDSEIADNLRGFKDKYARGPDTREQPAGTSLRPGIQPSDTDLNVDLQKILDAINRETKSALKALNFKHDCANQVKEHMSNISSLLDNMIAILNSIDVNRDLEAGLRNKIFSWSKDNINSIRDLIIAAKRYERMVIPEMPAKVNGIPIGKLPKVQERVRLNQTKTKNMKKYYRVCTPIFQESYWKFVKINKLLGGDGKPRQKRTTDKYDDDERKILEDTKRQLRDLEKEYDKTQ